MVKKLAIIVLAVCLCLAIMAPTYAAAKTFKTTADATYVMVTPKDTSNPPKPNDVADYANKGYGISKTSAGLKYILRSDLLKSKYTGNINKGKKLLSLFTMSDIHITDIQSPAQALAFGKSGMIAAYSPTILYTTQELEAAVESVNKINAAKKIDFGVMLGDAINNAQQNELDMYLDVLTGRMVYPNSDLSKTSNTDYTQPFHAQGLNVPWYQVVGNHDHFWSGVFNANQKLNNALISDKVMQIGTNPLGSPLDGNDIYPGIIDVSDPYGKIIGDGKDFTAADEIAPNTTRTFLGDKSFCSMFPSGHGIKNSARANPTGCYTFEPKAKVPFRVIVLNDTANQATDFSVAKQGDITGNGAFGFLDKTRFVWFSKQLADANKEKKLVMVAIHVPLGVGMWSNISEISEQQVISEIQKYSNIALVTAGHRHVNTVTAFKSPKASKPELGFWQVETASLRDFPQQYRIYDISVNSDNTIAIKTTNVDPANTASASKSRSYAIAISQIVASTQTDPNLPKDPSGAYNAILLKRIPSTLAHTLRQIK
jgi:metallophosphoesterase (TIGR03768 family)